MSAYYFTAAEWIVALGTGLGQNQVRWPIQVQYLFSFFILFFLIFFISKYSLNSNFKFKVVPNLFSIIL
jgi:hypothetical protein